MKYYEKNGIWSNETVKRTSFYERMKINKEKKPKRQSRHEQEIIGTRLIGCDSGAEVLKM